MADMRKLITAYNRKLLDIEEKKQRKCDCTKQECPVNGECLTENLVFQSDWKSYKITLSLMLAHYHSKIVTQNIKSGSNMKSMATLQFYRTIYGSLKIIKLI